MKVDMEIEGSKIQVGLDKLVIGIPYPTQPKPEGLNQVTSEQVALFDAQKKEFVASMKHIESVITKLGPYHCSKTQNNDLKRYKVLSEEDGALLCIFTLGFSYGTGVINFEMNPSKLTSDRRAELNGLLSVMFNGHYEEVYTKGVVSHAEFYVDVPGTEFSCLVLVDDSRRTTTHHKGTTYHGRRGARQVATMYDKAKEQKQEGKLVRIEARINCRDIRFQHLVEKDLFNPFSKLLVVDVIQLHSVAQEMKVPKVANLIKEFGLYGAGINKPARKAILSKLKDNAVSWWQPAKFWAAHRDLLMKLRPGHAGDIT